APSRSLNGHAIPTTPRPAPLSPLPSPRPYLPRMSKAPNTGTTCPSCGTRSHGKFCAECGAALTGVVCAACQSPLTPGARFCHACGTPAGGAAPRSVRGGRGAGTAPAEPAPRSILPWAIGVVSVLALVLAVAVPQRDASAPA